MFFDHVFSLSHREAKGLELRRRGLFVVTECLGARPPSVCISPPNPGVSAGSSN